MTLINLFISFIKIGFMSFGGGLAMIPFFQNDIISNGWFDVLQYSNVIAVAQIIPGAFAVDSSTFIGYMTAGFPGAIVATLGVTLPSLIILSLISKFYDQFKLNKWGQIILNGVRPVVIGLLLVAIYSVGIKTLLPEVSNLISFDTLKTLLLLAGAIYMTFRFRKTNPIFFILLFGVLGFLIY